MTLPLTIRTLPRQTTAKAPWPMRSFELYSQIPMHSMPTVQRTHETKIFQFISTQIHLSLNLCSLKHARFKKCFTCAFDRAFDSSLCSINKKSCSRKQKGLSLPKALRRIRGTGRKTRPLFLALSLFLRKSSTTATTRLSWLGSSLDSKPGHNSQRPHSSSTLSNT